MSGSVGNTKVVVIGLDGASFNIIDPLVKAGKLPNIRKLIGDGSRGVLRSVVPPYSPPAWMSMLTGKNPGKHGVFHFLRRKAASYDLTVTSFRDVSERTLFSILADEGVGSGVMNVPMTYPPPDEVRGFFVSGIPVPPGSRSYASPPEIHEILERTGYRVDHDFRGFDPNREEAVTRWENYQALLDGLMSIARKRVDCFLDLVERGDLPLYFLVISITDRVQHYFWRFADEGHPGFSEEGRRKLGDAIDKTYILVDQLVGKIVEKCGEGANYVLVSDHGAGPHCGDFHLNGWLIENGFLKVKPVPRLVVKRRPLEQVLARLGIGSLAGLFPRAIRSKVIPFPGRKRHRDGGDVIWSETRAFSSMYGIRVNIRGREPEGVVENGREYLEVVDQIRTALDRLVNPVDGTKLLTECVTKEEAFSGPYLDGSPDIFLNLAGISVLPTEAWETGDPYVPRRRCPSSGTHRIEGIFVGAGPDFVKGVDLGEIRIEDVMPTVLYLFDASLPRDIDGHVLLEAMKAKRPLKIESEASPGVKDVKGAKGYSAEEEEQITENLRGMGYI